MELATSNLAQGQVNTAIPQDLYIPPDALQLFLETFEGPMDLLLYLIKKQNINILDIPVAQVSQQYIQYIELMQELNLELAAEYLVMAAFLTEVKSRLLLPKPAVIESEEADPRAELVRKLQEYERFKKVAEELDELPRLDRDIYLTSVDNIKHNIIKIYPSVDLNDLLNAFSELLKRLEHQAHHHIQLESLSIQERMGEILSKMQLNKFIQFSELFILPEGRLGVVVTFIAILELTRQSLIELIQTRPYAPIYLQPISKL